MYMSNEYKDWVSDLHTTFTEECVKFDLPPPGWIKAFVPQMIDHLVKVLGPYTDNFVLLDAKEKYGTLRVYWTWKTGEYTPEEIEDMSELRKDIDKIITCYEHMSECTCYLCGNKTSYFSKKYEAPMCKTCEDKMR